jgi:hypothetical protein
VVHDVTVLAAASFVFLGTVLRMWDSLADADRTGEFAPRSSREEIHRLRLFFTLLDRRAHAATEDKQLYYLRVAQGWFCCRSVLSWDWCWPLRHLVTDNRNDSPPVG